MQLVTQGYSLVELCWVLTLSVILLGIAAPPLYDLSQYLQMQAQVNQLVQLLNSAKLQAIQSQKTVSLCMSLDHYHCNPAWQGDFIVFIDKQQNGQLTQPEDLLHIWQRSATQGYFTWQAQQTYLSLRPSGISPGNAGRFYYCPASNNLHYARAIIINLVGRIRIADRQADPHLHCVAE